MDLILVVNRVIEKFGECTQSLFLAFIDDEKALHSVHAAAVSEALKDQGITATYIELLDDMYKVSTDRITLHKQSDNFPIRNGPIHGDITSPKLID